MTCMKKNHLTNGDINSVIFFFFYPAIKVINVTIRRCSVISVCPSCNPIYLVSVIFHELCCISLGAVVEFAD